MPRHLVLVTVDTLRGDHFGSTRAGESLTPFLDRLAARAVVFDEAMSASDATTPGTAGILTGLWPHRSGVIANNHVIAPRVPTLAKLLRAAGFRTGGFVSNPNLRGGTGFEQGFEVYERVRPPRPPEDGGDGGDGESPAGAGEPTAGRVKAPAEAVTQAALDWLDTLAPQDERVFLWVHYMEPHGPYQPPEWARELFPSEAFEGPARVPLLADNSGKGGIPQYQHPGASVPGVGDARDYLARYAAEVRAIDDGLARLFRSLEQRGLEDEAVCVVTADHGEALAGERGFWFSHANGASRDQVHVPLLLAYPGCAAGTRVAGPVSTVDVAPSVLGLLGVAVPPELDGRGLLEPGSRRVLSVTQNEVALRDGPWRLIARPDGRPRLLLDDEADPASERDLAQREPEALRELLDALEALRSVPALASPTER